MTKKSFRNHPALKFISSAQVKEDVAEGTEKPATAPAPTVTPPAPPVTTPQQGTQKAEAKSRRVQILLQPGLYDRARADALEQNLSFNEYLHRALQHYLNRTK